MSASKEGNAFLLPFVSFSSVNLNCAYNDKSNKPTKVFLSLVFLMKMLRACERMMIFFTTATLMMQTTVAVVRNANRPPRDCITTSVTGRAMRESRVFSGEAAKGDVADAHQVYIAVKI